MSSDNDFEVNNLGPGGVANPEDAELRRRLNQDLKAALDNIDFRSRRSAIMAQIRNEQADAGNAAIPSATSVQTERELPSNVRSIANRRRFALPSWTGAAAAALVVLVVGWFVLTLVTSPSIGGVFSTVTKSLGGYPVANNAASGNGTTEAAATTTSAATTTAAATTTEAATTTSAADTTSAATTEAAVAASNAQTTTAAAATTTAAMTTSAASAGGVATTSTAAESSRGAAVATPNVVAPVSAQPTLANANGGSQPILPGTNIVLPVYPSEIKLTVNQVQADTLLKNLLDTKTSQFQLTLATNSQLLEATKVKGADLPQWYTDRLLAQHLQLTAVSNGEASAQPSIANIAWRTFSANNSNLLYFFISVNNPAYFNRFFNRSDVNSGDTIVLVFGNS